MAWCNKKQYNSEAEAEQFAKQHEAEYGPQRAYACENCNYYHLTTTGSGLLTPVTTNYRAIENMAVPPTRVAPAPAVIAEMRKLRAQGMSKVEIARQTGFTTTTVTKYVEEEYGQSRLSAVAAKKARLEEQLRRFAEEQKRLEEEEQRIIEESRLKVEQNDNGVLIHKNLKGLTLSLEDCRELHAALGKILSDVAAVQGLKDSLPITEASAIN